MTQARRWINLPYAEKDEGKALGARWDPVIRRWYVPDGIDMTKFRKWWFEEPEDIKTAVVFSFTEEGVWSAIVDGVASAVPTRETDSYWEIQIEEAAINIVHMEACWYYPCDYNKCPDGKNIEAYNCEDRCPFRALEWEMSWDSTCGTTNLTALVKLVRDYIVSRHKYYQHPFMRRVSCAPWRLRGAGRNGQDVVFSP